jgi:titin
MIGAPDYSLVTGSVYRFRVKAFNFNGPSAESAVTSVQACGIPSGIAKPIKVSTNTATPSVTISWSAPTSDGGCPISGYRVYVDDGAGGSYVEANSDSDVLVRNISTLR